MGGLLAGLLKGFAGAQGEHKKTVARQQEAQQDLESRVFSSLLNVEDPEVRAIAAAGLMDASSPRKSKGFFSRFIGETTANPRYEQLREWMLRGGPPGMEGPGPGAGVPPATGAPTPPPPGVGLPPGAPGAPVPGAPPVTPPALGAAPALPGTPPPSAGMAPTTGPTPQGVESLQAQPPPPPVMPELLETPESLEQRKVTKSGYPSMRPITPSKIDMTYDEEFARSKAKADSLSATLQAAGATPEEIRNATMISVGVAPKAKAQTPYQVRVEAARLRIAASRAVGQQPDQEDLILDEIEKQREKLTPSERDKFLQAEAFKRSENTASHAWERAKLMASTSIRNTNARVAAQLATAGGMGPDGSDELESWAQAVHTGQANVTNVPTKARGKVLDLMRQTNRPVWSKELQKVLDTHTEAEVALEEGALMLDEYLHTDIAREPMKAGLAYWRYSNFVRSFLSRQAARASGESSRLTEQDVTAFKALLDLGPVASKMVPEEAQKRIEGALTLLQKIRDRRLKAYADRVGWGEMAGHKKPKPLPPGYVEVK